MSFNTAYCGRFAPSPTGPLHFGSLVAAVGSYLDARKQGGKWLIRMEDLDPPREEAGAADSILRTLDAFGFQWDGGVFRQSERLDAYRDAANDLFLRGSAYSCHCSRREVAEAGIPGVEGVVYPGTCRDRPHIEEKQHAIRILTDKTSINFEDRLHGRVEQSLERDVGDFIIRRADGLFAYQLAVVLDDACQGINQVVRGADLLLSTPRQIYLQRLLSLPEPTYTHLPLVLDAGGHKLSKQTQAPPVDGARPLPALIAALRFLGQPLPEESLATLEEVWAWAESHWDLTQVPHPMHGIIEKL